MKMSLLDGGKLTLATGSTAARFASIMLRIIDRPARPVVVAIRVKEADLRVLWVKVIMRPQVAAVDRPILSHMVVLDILASTVSVTLNRDQVIIMGKDKVVARVKDEMGQAQTDNNELMTPTLRLVLLMVISDPPVQQ
jgi:hypothetical protein